MCVSAGKCSGLGPVQWWARMWLPLPIARWGCRCNLPDRSNHSLHCSAMETWKGSPSEAAVSLSSEILYTSTIITTNPHNYHWFAMFVMPHYYYKVNKVLMMLRKSIYALLCKYPRVAPSFQMYIITLSCQTACVCVLSSILITGTDTLNRLSLARGNPWGFTRECTPCKTTKSGTLIVNIVIIANNNY